MNLTNLYKIEAKAMPSLTNIDRSNIPIHLGGTLEPINFRGI
jgi:hypothetical protein